MYLEGDPTRVHRTQSHVDFHRQYMESQVRTLLRYSCYVLVRWLYPFWKWFMTSSDWGEIRVIRPGIKSPNQYSCISKMETITTNTCIFELSRVILRRCTTIGHVNVSFLCYKTCQRVRYGPWSVICDLGITESSIDLQTSSGTVMYHPII